MGAMPGNLDHTAELEVPSVRAGRFTRSRKPAQGARSAAHHARSAYSPKSRYILASGLAVLPRRSSSADRPPEPREQVIRFGETSGALGTENEDARSQLDADHEQLAGTLGVLPTFSNIQHAARVLVGRNVTGSVLPLGIRRTSWAGAIPEPVDLLQARGFRCSKRAA